MFLRDGEMYEGNPENWNECEVKDLYFALGETSLNVSLRALCIFSYDTMCLNIFPKTDNNVKYIDQKRYLFPAQRTR